MAAPVSLLRPSAPKKDRVVSNHPAPGEAQLVAIKDMAQTLDQKIRQNGCKHANLPSKNEISLVNSGFVFVMFSFKPCQTISILPLSTIRTFKCESHVQIVSSGICSRHKFLSLQYVIPGQSQSCGRWHKSQASMSSWEKRVGWQSDDMFPAPGDVHFVGLPLASSMDDIFVLKPVTRRSAVLRNPHFMGEEWLVACWPGPLKGCHVSILLGDLMILQIIWVNYNIALSW